MCVYVFMCCWSVAALVAVSGIWNFRNKSKHCLTVINFAFFQIMLLILPPVVGRSLPRFNMHRQGGSLRWRVWVLALAVWTLSKETVFTMSAVPRLIPTHLCIYYFFQSSCTSDFSGITYWRNVGQGIFVIGNGKTLVPSSEGIALSWIWWKDMGRHRSVQLSDLLLHWPQASPGWNFNN